MTIPQAAEKVFDFTESITDSDTRVFELSIGEGRSVYFEAYFEVDWDELPESDISPPEYDRTRCDISSVILTVSDDDSGEVIEDLTKELQREFCKWFGEVEFED